MRLAGKTTLITGAGSGIGRAIALGYGREGARVAAADLNLAAAEATAAAIRGQGGQAMAAAVDVSHRASVEAMLAEVLRAWPRVDVLVNAAGIGPVRPFLEIPEEEWDRVLAVNLKGLFLVGQAVARQMRPAGGVIINVTSQVADVAQPDCAHYYASKGGAKQLTKAMAIDLAPHNIRVNALAPGLTVTALSEASAHSGAWSYRVKIMDHIPMGRPARPEEMVGPAVFLASDESSYMTGASLVVDGGYTAI